MNCVTKMVLGMQMCVFVCEGERVCGFFFVEWLYFALKMFPFYSDHLIIFRECLLLIYSTDSSGGFIVFFFYVSKDKFYFWHKSRFYVNYAKQIEKWVKLRFVGNICFVLFYEMDYGWFLISKFVVFFFQFVKEGI